MGSFSVACSISKISINYGDKCVVIPIYKNPIYKDSYSGYLAGPCDRYMPLVFPIFGYYNDYGGIKYIEKDENTKLIENYFGVSIEDFIECINYRNYDKINDDNKRKMLEDVYFMYVLSDVYEYCYKNNRNDYFYNKKSVLKNLDEGIKTLNDLVAFEFKKENYLIGKEKDFFDFSASCYRYTVEDLLIFRIVGGMGNPNRYFRDIYFQTIYNGKMFHKPSDFFFEKFLEFFYFITSMIGTNSIFDMVRQGEQVGQTESELQNMKFYCSILEERLRKEQEEDY